MEIEKMNVAILSAILFAGCAAALIGFSIYENLKNKKAPVLTTSATVLKKLVHRTRRNNLYVVTFQTVEGEQLSMKVNCNVYEQLSEGDTGMLTHQGTWYKGFVPNGE